MTDYSPAQKQRLETEDALKKLLDMFGADWTAFNNLVVNFPVPREPQLLAPNRAKFGYDFLIEEATEFKKASAEGDLDGAVDALIDLIYVAVGRLGEMGVLVQPTWAEVQRANMEKRKGNIDKPRSDGSGYDAVKPVGWTAPDHLPYLDITAEDVQILLLMKKRQERIGLQDSVLAVNVGGDTFYQLTRDEVALLNRAKEGIRSKSQLELKLDGSAIKEILDEGLARIEELKQPVQLHHIEDRKPRILVLGHGRHGKDTVCELLANQYDLKFTSSSWFCAERVVMPALDGAQFQYKDVEACYNDRHNHRALWYDLIRDFNRPDATALGRAIWAENDVYCGLRSKAEFHALKNAGVFDFAIWVDASDRLPPEDASSITVEPWMADFVLDNNGTLEDLKLNLQQLMEYVL